MLKTGVFSETYTTEANSWYRTSSDGSLWYLTAKKDNADPQLSKLNSHDPSDSQWTTKLPNAPFMAREVTVSVADGFAYHSEGITASTAADMCLNTLARSRPQSTLSA